MGKTKWTNEQEKAITTRGCNLLVAAAAGSGKTAVLVERIIKMITDKENPIDIDRLLIVTYTNAAAGEMRERIAQAIYEEMSSSNSIDLSRQLTLLSRASITTIHSFCLQVIRNNFHKLDLDPEFRVGDETENILLKQEALDELMEERYNENNSDFISLVESYSSNKDDRAIYDMVLKLYNFSISFPWQKEWLYDTVEKFNVENNFKFENLPWIGFIKKEIENLLLAHKVFLVYARDLIIKTPSIEGYRETIEDDISIIDDCISTVNNNNLKWNDIKNIFCSIKFKNLKSCRKVSDKDKSVQETIQDIRKIVKSDINDLLETIFFQLEEEIESEFGKLYPILKCLCDLVLEFKEIYKNKKKARGIIDFNDIEHYCLDILTSIDEKGEVIPSDTALDLREKFEEILIDEYQDSNLIQESILNSICKSNDKNSNLFMVGDVKQSIYRFRQAKPELFLKKYNEFSDEEGSTNRKILLFKNFRSRENIINGVNFIFKQIMYTSTGELNYTDKEALNLGATFKEIKNEAAYTEDNIEVCIIDSSIKQEEKKVINSIEENQEILDPIRLEAKAIGMKIKEIFKSNKEGKRLNIFDKSINEYRPVEYRDIVVLLRTTSNWSNVFTEEFKNLGIPVYADTGTGYFESVEIKTMLSLLQIIDNPIQDIPLLSILRSPIFPFTADELVDIRSLDKEDSFYFALEKASKIFKIKENLMDITENEQEIDDSNISIDLCKKAFDFLNTLEKFRNISLHMPLDEFIWYLYTYTGYYGNVLAMQNGVQRQANLRVLFQKAKQYESTSYKGVFNFITFMNKLKISNGDMGSAQILGENDNVVRIMSIHKSKGLEFPVVILGGAGKQFNLRDTQESILFHYELGFGPEYVDYEKRVKYPTIAKEILKRNLKIESLSEEMRILYVALTRAKEKLIIFGTVKDINRCINKWNMATIGSSDKIKEYIVSNGRNYLDWICSTLISHKDGKEIKWSQDYVEYTPPQELLNDKSKFKINLIKREDIEKDLEDKNTICDENIKFQEEFKKQSLEKDNEFHSKYGNLIDKKLGYKYKYSDLAKIPAKISVTDFKRRYRVTDEDTTNIFSTPIIKKPKFLEKKGLTGAEKGTAFHTVLQHIDIYNTQTIEDIKLQINQMVFNEIITEQQADCIVPNKILKFFKSPLGMRIKESKNSKREFAFQIKLENEELEKIYNLNIKLDSDSIILQGAIDCYFEENDELVLVDYKTDYVDMNNIDSIKDRYKIQLELYSKALKKITGKNVREKYLYLFYNGEIIKMD